MCGWIGMIFVGDSLYPFDSLQGSFSVGRQAKLEKYLSEKSHGASRAGSFLAPVSETLLLQSQGRSFSTRPTQQETEWEVTPICLGEQGEDRKGLHSGLTAHLQAAQE